MKWVKKVTWTWCSDGWWFWYKNPKKLWVFLSKPQIASLMEHKNWLIFKNLLDLPLVLVLAEWYGDGEGVGVVFFFASCDNEVKMRLSVYIFKLLDKY